MRLLHEEVSGHSRCVATGGSVEVTEGPLAWLIAATHTYRVVEAPFLARCSDPHGEGLPASGNHEGRIVGVCGLGFEPRPPLVAGIRPVWSDPNLDAKRLGRIP